MRFNLLQYVVPEVKELYNWLEVDFHPLKLSGRVTKVNKLAANYGFYLHYVHLNTLSYVKYSNKCFNYGRC